MQMSLPLSDYLATPPYGVPAATELAAFLADWHHLHADALRSARPRIHPTAYVHPTAIVGAGAHPSAQVTAAAIHLTTDMRKPDHATDVRITARRRRQP